jgi:hypothetical protein
MVAMDWVPPGRRSLSPRPAARGFSGIDVAALSVVFSAGVTAVARFVDGVVWAGNPIG